MAAAPPLPESPWAYALAVSAGQARFREEYFSSVVGPRGAGLRWGDYQARISRYAAYWSLFESNAYSAIHAWAADLKEDLELYQAIRCIYNPAYRIGEFWANHLWGGRLDPAAGDGKAIASALPIATENEAIRPPIAQVWRNSTWQVNKEALTRFGAVMGDVGLAVVDDEVRQQVYFRVVHPYAIRDIALDPRGNVKTYVLIEDRPDPEWDLAMGPAPDAKYMEICDRIGTAVRFRTFKLGVNGYEPYDWRDYPPGTPDSAMVGPEWTQDYGFCPFLLFRHRDVGVGGGWSELHPSLSKLHEIDNIASNLHDQVAIAVRAVWFFSGMKGPSKLNLPEGENPEKDVAAIYCADPQGHAQPLVSPISIAETLACVRALAEEIERNHPELQADMATASGDASGRALRVARERVSRMVDDRRATYDDGVVRAHMMALSIGAQKGYPGFEGFTAESFARGELDHAIGERPVFAVSEADRIELETARAALLESLARAGMPLEASLKLAGLTDEQVAEVAAAKVEEDKAKLGAVQAAQAAMFARQGRLPVTGGNGVAMKEPAQPV